MTTSPHAASRPRIGISRCLLGEQVRFDGGHKRDPFLLGPFAPHVEWVPVCPEVEVGMGIPRESIQLVAADDGVPAGAEQVRLLGVRSRTDWTSKMADWSATRARALQKLDLGGFILKKDSPSCGVERVRVYHGPGAVTRTGRGLFAESVVTLMPDLPVEEEGRLSDPRLRENFIERVFAYERVKRLFTGRWTHGQVVAFHTAHKLQLLAHSRQRYTELGRLVADGAKAPRAEFAQRYTGLFMSALKVMATPGRHADVMQHMLGHLKRHLDDASRAELLALIEEHRTGLVPLVVPLTLLRHHVRRFDVAYLAQQVYLDPHPRELALRNHV